MSSRLPLQILSFSLLLGLLGACADKSEDCLPEADEDGDGYCGSADCDLKDGSINPDATDRYQDGVDQDCDGADGTDEDGDGYPPGDVDVTDCDDNDGAVGPGATELCDGLDNDCDGVVDEDDATDASTWYADGDGDGHGNAGSLTDACDRPDGHVASSDDCDDADAERHPDADDFIADGTDQDCDGVDGADRDGDGFIAGLEGDGDCDDADPDVYPGATERCDDIDNDCDEITDEDDAEDASVWYVDADGDGYGDSELSAAACDEPDGYVDNAEDCDDTRAEVSPDGVETPEIPYDEIDNDCYVETLDDDLDEDGYDLDEDCDDEDASSYPGAAEVCDDGVVNDCDGSTGDAMAECGLEGELSAADVDATLVGEGYNQRAGSALAGVGDVDGDGAPDLLIGACRAMATGGEGEEGKVFLVRGSVTGERSLADADATLEGQTPTGQAGSSVSGIEVDLDGYGDLLVGAPEDGVSGADSGSVFLVRGPVDGTVALDSDAAVQLVGSQSSQGAGFAVSAIADQDDDGVAEILIGNYSQNHAYRAAYIVSGAVSGALDLGEESTWLAAEDTGDCTGRALASAGDLDGDSVEDLVVGGYCYGSEDLGVVYIFAGPVSSGVHAVSDASFKLVGASSSDFVGRSVAGAGDTDGDGLDDVLVGAVGDDRGGSYAGAAFLLLGPVSGSGEIGTYAAAKLFGEFGGDEAGNAVSSAGDVDADGLADLLVGAVQADSDGAAYLVLSPVSGKVDLATADVKLAGDAESTGMGTAVALAGDTNGDGFADLLVGAPYATVSAVFDGAAYLILGGGY